MNKLLLTTILFTALVSCDKKAPSEDEVGISEPISSINISDATAIYERSTDVTRTIGESTYWKIDAAGNESELKIFADDETASQIKIIQ